MSFAAVILAAGMSRRMGSPKALLDLDGRPLIAHLVDTIDQTGLIDRTFIVTGHQPQTICDSVSNRNITFVHNAAYETGGMLSSVKTGVRAAAAVSDAFFLLLLDQPLVKPATLIAMAETLRQQRSDLVVPAYKGKRGHPILLTSRCRDPILSLPNDATLKDFVDQHRSQCDVVEAGDPGVLTTLDTPADYLAILNFWRTTTCPPVPTVEA